MGRPPLRKSGAMTPAERLRRHRAKVAKERKRAPLLAGQKRRQDREAALGAKIKALPDRRFGVIYADPAWRFEVWSEESGSGRSASSHYGTTTIEAIKALNVPSIAAPDCVLFMWAIAPMLPEALAVLAGCRGVTGAASGVLRKARRQEQIFAVRMVRAWHCGARCHWLHLFTQ
jgi:hypothetical protein